METEIKIIPCEGGFYWEFLIGGPTFRVVDCNGYARTELQAREDAEEAKRKYLEKDKK
jgi:hypothetical protein